MDLRPQAHEIIRTWLFSTVVRAHLEFDALPWTDAAISGWVLDPDRKKMSKSKGNVVTPDGTARAVRLRRGALLGGERRPGTDTAFDDGQMKVGRRLAIKILNASKFVLGVARSSRAATVDRAARPRDAREPCRGVVARGDVGVRRLRLRAGARADRAVLLELLRRLRRAREAARRTATRRRRRSSAVAGLRIGARRRAPAVRAVSCPFVTEEVWSWWREGSVHRAAWPAEDELAVSGDGDAGVFAVASDVLTAVRKEKALAKVSLRVPAVRVVVHDAPERLAMLRLCERDVCEAGNIQSLETIEAETFSVETTLGEPA